MESDRISEFIRQYVPDPGEELKKLRAQAIAEEVPIIRQETEAFLRTLLTLQRPKRVLELGTAVGYSAIYMASASAGIERIDTIEDWDPRIPKARSNIEKAGLADRIFLMEGDALEIMKGLTEPYDLVFIDAAKGQYPEYLTEAIRLTREGSVIIADNIFQDGEIMESKYIVERRDRTIHKRLRTFLDMVSNDSRLSTSVLPVGDGITFSVRCA
ncbi:MAG: O-methyltransferase [Lachnospiraceae bacterium]|nr:O-methyltransferase [Lachnospiraceae bacterium]